MDRNQRRGRSAARSAESPFGVRLVALLSLALVAWPAQAIVLSLSGPDAPVTVGESFEVSLAVSELGDEIVSAFDLDVVFDPGLFTASDVVFGTMLGGPSGSASGSLIGAGRVDLFELSFLSDDTLTAMQGDPVTLATLMFTAAGEGNGRFAFDVETPPGLDVKGREALRLEFDAVNGYALAVAAPPVSVPEPAPLALLSAALALLAWRRRASNRAADG
jgi:hypothetical protein